MIASEHPWLKSYMFKSSSDTLKASSHLLGLVIYSGKYTD